MSNAAGMYAAAYPKLSMGMPYNMASMYAAANPMYAASLASLGYMAQMQKAGMVDAEKEPGEITEGEERKEDEKSGDERETSPAKSTASSLASASAHPSFPFMYNPMLYAQSLYAQSLAAANFTLPTGMPTSFSTLAQQQNLMNGTNEANSDKEETAAKSDSEQGMIAEDLSVKKPAKKVVAVHHHEEGDDSDQPLNLDTKKPSSKSTPKKIDYDQPLELTKGSSRRKQMFTPKEKHRLSPSKQSKHTAKEDSPQHAAQDLSAKEKP